VRGGVNLNKIGFIGYGSMGSMLIRGFIETGQVRQEQIVVTRKDKSRLVEIKETWPEICIAQDAVEVIKNAECIFICVKPLEYTNILKEIKPFVYPHHHIVSITGTVAIKNIEKIVDCGITKVMPTIVSEAKEGISLVCHNSKVTEEASRRIESLFGNISKVWRIDEKDFEFASEFTSCGPGLIAAVFKELVDAGLRHNDSFNNDQLTEMVLQTLYGTAKLMLEKKMDFRDVILRVATKGGITEEGVKVIEKSLPQVFNEMIDKCMNKRIAVGEKISDDFK